MYYPYLRGRQFELIALRELAEKNLVSDNIIPIVEPVKISSTLLSFMDTYTKVKRPFGIIQNPEHGSFIDEIGKNKNYSDNYVSYFKNYSLQPVFIFNKHIENTQPLNFGQKSIAICKDPDMLLSIERLTKIYNTDSFVIRDERIFKRGVHGNRILIDDKFNKQKKNADYADSDDEPFSDDHLYFKEEGYKGFSDYSIIGDDYTESGFAPYAVAIHMVYFDKNMNLRVHHFVSDTNDDYADAAGKFAEALKKLIQSQLFKDCNTFGFNEFKKFSENAIYSGLGIVKKLSLMHHFELMSQFLQGRY
jgi:hypothetical protein